MDDPRRSEDRKHRRFLLLVVGVSFLFRASLMIPLTAADIVLEADENEYYSRATAFKKIVSDAARGKELYSQDLLRAYGGGTFPPLHPLFLSSSLFVSEDPLLARWAVVVFSSLTTPLVYFLTLLCSARRAALAAAWTHALYPSFVAFSHYLWSETTYVFFLVLTAYLTIRLVDQRTNRLVFALLAGSCLALAALTRAAALPFLAVIPLWTYLSLRKTSRAVAATLVMLATIVIVLSPWEVALYSREGRLVPLSTAAGYNFFLGNNPWERSGRFEANTKPKVIAAIDEYARTHDLHEDEAARILALRGIQRAPVAFVKRCFQKLRGMLTVDRFIFRHVLHAIYPPMAFGAVIFLWCWVALSLVAMVGMAVLGLIVAEPRMRHRGFLLTLVAFGMVPPLVTVADTRSTLPLLALLLPAVGHGLTHFSKPNQLNGRIKGGLSLMVAGAAAVIIAVNVLTYASGRQLSPKTSSYYYPLVQRVDRLTGSETPFADRVSLRVDDPEIEGQIRIRLLSDGYGFHVSGNRRRKWIYSRERAELTLNVYAYQPSEPMRMQIQRNPLAQSVVLEPIGRDAWRRWRPSGVHGVQYRWGGAGPPPPERKPRE